MTETKALRQAQLIMLEMLVEFDAICTKHHFKYWLDSGTLLGAVRHEGFIPWDDDIDLSMPVEDYNKFIEIAKDTLSENIFFQTKESDEAFKFDYIKLRSNKASIVEFHEKDREVGYHQGVFVDIFPMLTLENSKENQHFYEDTFEEIRACSSVSLHTPNGVDEPKKREALVSSLEQRHQGWEKEDTKIIYSGKMPDVAAWFDYKEIFPLKKMLFEGLAFWVPHNPHHYLSENYSFNYMELPPEDKRAIHAWKIEFSK
ncbi:MAG: Lipopolysaccharide cholinephosphotransferase LicD1 (EC [uncultured Sulfurovum sp.]|uniref:Lipopolysaccharide cholinephosphotransferase LicD1 (EC) n=1 Tax=uncultured Sulfurovum sp. TaxID=269237 RepID=A0A6S6U4N2_9BACT|nr:MAG: Lipopolysaccharide cholinephosphotransferase LicD1 (EC [uncultured Sulfurovum sp.]